MPTALGSSTAFDLGTYVLGPVQVQQPLNSRLLVVPTRCLLGTRKHLKPREGGGQSRKEEFANLRERECDEVTVTDVISRGNAMDLNGTVLLVSCQMCSQVSTTCCYKERQVYV